LTAPSPKEEPVPSDLDTLDAVRRSDAILDALGERDTAICEPDDPVIGLLGALALDVDQENDVRPPTPRHGRRRRGGPRTIVALGVSSVVLATTGVAAAGGGLDSVGGPAAGQGPVVRGGSGQSQTATGRPVAAAPKGERGRNQKSRKAVASGGDRSDTPSPTDPPAGPSNNPGQIVLPIVVPSPTPTSTTTPTTAADPTAAPPLAFGPGNVTPSPSPTATDSPSPTVPASPSPSAS
jgi:hypothetical protein